jgi:thioredoxin 2
MTKNTISCAACGAKNRLPVATSGRPRCGKCQADLPWLVDVTSADFAATIEKSSLPVLVDLWAPWCGPCRMVAPALEKISRDRAGELRIVKVNVDDAPEISGRLGVQGIPTMILFADGVEVGRQVGAMPGPAIGSWIDATLAAAPAAQRG